MVLGADTSAALGVDQTNTTQVWLGGHWFTGIGILNPIPLAPELDRTALIGYPIAPPCSTPPSTQPRSPPGRPDRRQHRQRRPRRHANPAAPQNASITNPADALTAGASANNAFHGLLLALGAVAVIVGAVGIASVMIIAVLERCGEIGLRRALGATSRHIAAQFITEFALLAALGGTAGGRPRLRRDHHPPPPPATGTPPISPLTLAAGIAAALAIGVVAGLYPARRAAGLPPADAIRSV